MSVKKVTKKVQEKSKITHEPFTSKELKDVHTAVDKVLKDDAKGLVIVATENPKGGVIILGGRRNLSARNVIQIVCSTMNMTPVDVALMIATEGLMDSAEEATTKKKAVKKVAKKTRK